MNSKITKGPIPAQDILFGWFTSDCFEFDCNFVSGYFGNKVLAFDIGELAYIGSCHIIINKNQKRNLNKKLY